MKLLIRLESNMFMKFALFRLGNSLHSTRFLIKQINHGTHMLNRLQSRIVRLLPSQSVKKRPYIRSLFLKNNKTPGAMIQHPVEHAIQNHLAQPMVSTSTGRLYLASISRTGRPTSLATWSTSTRLKGSTIRNKFCSSKLSYKEVKCDRMIGSLMSSKSD